MVKIEFAGEVVRIYEEERGSRVNKYMVVADRSGKYPNVLRFNLKPDAALNCPVGTKVNVTAFLDGREWVNNEGKTFYFTDLKVSTVDVVSPAPASGDRPTKTVDWKSLLAVGASFGESEEDVKSRCRAYGKPFREMTAQDWQNIADGIATAHAEGETPVDDDDFPF